MTAPDLRAWRTRLGLTQEQAGEALGVDKQTVWRWEAGRTEPPPFLWRALRDVERERAEA